MDQQQQAGGLSLATQAAQDMTAWPATGAQNWLQPQMEAGIESRATLPRAHASQSSASQSANASPAPILGHNPAGNQPAGNQTATAEAGQRQRPRAEAATHADQPGSASQSEQEAKQSRAGVAGRCRYSKLARLVKARGLTPQQLTAENLDRSGQLRLLVRDRWDGQDVCVIGELQWAYLAFLLCQSLEGMPANDHIQSTLPSIPSSSSLPNDRQIKMVVF